MVVYPFVRRALFSVGLLWMAGCGDSGDAVSDPTYHRDIAPLVSTYCSSCHTEGRIAPFALNTYEEVKGHAFEIKSATQARIMPPFLADGSGECQTYRDSRWLSDQQIAMISKWVDNGTKKGNAADFKATTPVDATLNEVSAQLDIGVEYTPTPQPSAGGVGHAHDDYRCFVVDPVLTRDRYLTAYQAHPGAVREVHHIILFAIDTSAAEAEALQLDAEDATPGYQCFGGSRVSSGTRPVGGWAPGSLVTRYPATTGVKLSKERKLILQIHYNLDNGTSPDRTKFDLELVDSVEKTTQLLPIAQPTLNLEPGKSSVDANATLNVPIGANIWGVFPHMHTLGQSIHLTLTRSGINSCLLDVPRWDFNWQQAYFYTDPIAVKTGDSIALNCNYNTTSRTEVVHWGEGTSDEMCLVFAYVTDLPFTIKF